MSALNGRSGPIISLRDGYLVEEEPNGSAAASGTNRAVGCTRRLVVTRQEFTSAALRSLLMPWSL